MYQTLSGVHPWTGRSTIGEVIVAICTEPIPHLQDQAPWISAELAEVVHRAMARQLEDRFQSVAELAEALELFAEGKVEIRRDDLRPVPGQVRSEVKARATSIGADGQVSRVAQPGSRRGPKIALGAVAAVGLAAGALFLMREPAATEQRVPGAEPSVTSGATSGQPAASTVPSATSTESQASAGKPALTATPAGSASAADSAGSKAVPITTGTGRPPPTPTFTPAPTPSATSATKPPAAPTKSALPHGDDDWH